MFSRFLIYKSVRKLIFVISMLVAPLAWSQKKAPRRVVRDSVVEIVYTDGTVRRMVWVNDSTVMLVISAGKGRPFSRAYIDPEFAAGERRKYFVIKFEE